MPEQLSEKSTSRPNPTSPGCDKSPRDSVPDFSERIKRDMYGRWGLPGLAFFVFVCFMGPDIWKWTKVHILVPVYCVLAQKPIPKADPGRFAIALAHLEHDSDGEVERTLAQLLSEFDGVQQLRFDRVISLEGGDIEKTESAGHDEAKAYLSQSGAQVLIWGSVLHQGGDLVPNLR